MAIRIDGTNTTANPGITGADADTGLQFGTNELKLVTGGREAVKIDSNQKLTASQGILFGTDTAAANTLDDYEEGAWTPTFSGGTTAGAYTFTHEAWYVKIGRLVTVYAMLLNITDTTVGSGHVVIGGLPFTSNSSKDSVGSVRLDKFDLDSTTRDVSATVYENSSVIKLLETRDNTTDITMTVDDRTQDGSDIFVQITYFTA